MSSLALPSQSAGYVGAGGPECPQTLEAPEVARGVLSAERQPPAPVVEMHRQIHLWGRKAGFDPVQRKDVKVDIMIHFGVAGPGTGQGEGGRDDFGRWRRPVALRRSVIAR